MEKLILTDVDGVLVAWDTHFHTYMRSRGHEKAHNRHSYWQETYYPHMSEDKAREMVYHFNTSSWMIDVPAYKDARTGVARFVDNGYKFIAVTAMGLDPYALEVRKINLERLFGRNVFADVIATDMYDPDSKRESLSDFKDTGLPWIEDKPSNAELGAELGLNSFLLEHGYNKDYKPVGNVKCVSSWADICDVILTD